MKTFPISAKSFHGSKNVFFRLFLENEFELRFDKKFSNLQIFVLSFICSLSWCGFYPYLLLSSLGNHFLTLRTEGNNSYRPKSSSKMVWSVKLLSHIDYLTCRGSFALPPQGELKMVTRRETAIINMDKNIPQRRQNFINKNGWKCDEIHEVVAQRWSRPL